MIKLLVVDDSALMRRVLRDVFEAEGDFEVRTARDGIEALAAVRDAAPDVVTLDVTMPGMDGLECLSRIMVETPRPVVMVSAATQRGAEAALEALERGAVDVIAKPEGVVSIGIESIRPVLVRTVRAAAGARLRPSFRLRDRVRHRIGHAGAARPPASPARRPSPGPARPAITDAANSDRLLVIGASTGGPSAIEQVLSALPAEFPWPVVIAQHMPASFTGVFARRLDAIGPLRVLEVSSPMPIRPGVAHVARGDADMIIGRRAGALHAIPVPASATYPWHPSVDRLVMSALAHVEAPRILGVLMTGMGRDGAEAMATLHGQGGQTIAEDESTAVVWGMPGELVQRGGAGIVAPLPAIADAVRRLTEG